MASYRIKRKLKTFAIPLAVSLGLQAAGTGAVIGGAKLAKDTKNILEGNTEELK